MINQPNNPGGTPIKASEGGVVTVPGGTDEVPAPSLSIPAGALAGDTTVIFTLESATALGLPAEIEPLGSVINIGPAGLTLSSPALLSLPEPENVPNGKVLALVELPGAAAAQAANAITTQKHSFLTYFSRVLRTRLTALQMLEIPMSVCCALCLAFQTLKTRHQQMFLNRDGYTNEFPEAPLNRTCPGEPIS
jgi:hypothetical protein